MTFDDSITRPIVLRMEGWSNREIAARPGCVGRSVERKHRSIRRLWTKGEGP